MNMITVPELTQKHLREYPLLEEALARGIVNLSALARELQPGIEAELGKVVSAAAITMALKRLSPEIRKSGPKKHAGNKSAGDLIVRSNLVEFTFRHSESIWEKQKRLLHRLERDREVFLTFTQGVFEVMLIASAGVERAVLEIFEKETIVSHVKGLSAIIIRLSPRTMHIPGVYYSILKQLAWGNVNVIDVVSTFTEFTILIDKQQVDRAFTILTRYMWP
jgi:hypothetical protein